jgi:signal transduction histidine kinase
VKRPSLTRRLLLSSIAILGALLASGGGLLSFGFRRAAEARFEEHLDAWCQALVASLAVDPGGALDARRGLGDPRFERPLSGWYWEVSQSGRRMAASRSLWDAEMPAVAETGAVARVGGPRGRILGALARDVTLPGHDGSLRVQVAVDTAELDSEIARFDALLLAALGALGATVLALGAVLTRLAVRPLRKIEDEVVAVRDGRRERLDPDVPRELGLLVDATNALLDHDLALVERARANAADLAHAIKTPLSVIRAEAEELGGERGGRVARQADAIARHIERRGVRATALPAVAGRRVALLPVAAAIADTLARLHRHCAIEVDVPEALRFPGTREDLEEIVGNLLENACKWARTRVRLTARADAAGLEIAIEDDGDGLAPAARERARERGTRLDEQSPGSGLGLAIVEEVAALHGGALHLDAAALGGLRATVRLPAERIDPH